MISSNDQKYLEQLTKTHQCPEHGEKLVVAWHTKENSYVIRCGEGHFPEEITTARSRTQDYKVGKLEQVGRSLDLLPKTDLGTGEALGPAMMGAIISYAAKYALDAFRGHVMIMHGKPYIGLDGYLFHANRSGQSYQLKSRPLHKEERVMYKIGEDDHGWLSEVTFPDTGGYFVGIGIVTKDEMLAKSPRDDTKLRSPVVAAHPWQLAQKRADWQVMRRAFPIGETEKNEEK